MFVFFYFKSVKSKNCYGNHKNHDHFKPYLTEFFFDTYFDSICILNSQLDTYNSDIPVTNINAFFFFFFTFALKTRIKIYLLILMSAIYDELHMKLYNDFKETRLKLGSKIRKTTKI